MSIPALSPRTVLPVATALLSFVLAVMLVSAAHASVAYTYDAHHRLASATYDDGTSERYTYDDTGNRLVSASSTATTRTHENAEDGDTLGWDIYDNDPVGATIANVYDTDRASRVIEFTGSGANNGYRLRNVDGVYWNDTRFKALSWSMKYSEPFTVYIAVQTTNGFRYLYYTPDNTSLLGKDTYVHHGLGTQARNGQWQTFHRDLAYDLTQAQPGNELISVLGFLIRGSGRVDDIATRSGLPAELDTDGDGLTDVLEIGTYGTNPYDADTDADDMDDKAELEFWGANWNADPDGDGLINLLDSDADNDGFSDGLERRQGTNPADASSAPASILYENAEDGDTLGWDIYDNDPVGATIANVYDSDRGGRVIEFTGSGTENGYRLRNASGSSWNDARFNILEWSMRYSESFVIYIAVQTKNGFRYLYYTAENTNRLGNDVYVHHGLGVQARNGQWHTFDRDLAHDLKDAQPDNELQAVLGFLIRGSGRVDDIATRSGLPAELDTDGDGLTDVLEIGTYGTNPYDADTDADDMDDKAELEFWGANWNADPDGDGLINLLDSDADNDGFSDGLERRQGTDPADASSAPASILYENAEDGDTLGWDIYDNDPVGATIANVYDTDRTSRVIEFTGSGANNGYRLRNVDGVYWNDSRFKVLSWSMKYSEPFTVYIAVQTTNGFRYLYYTPDNTSLLGKDTYVHHGLGTQARNGQWQTFDRDLAHDLKDTQPDNELQAVLGFLIRGSGRVDEIKTEK